jgi:glycosyltransferase involved in cell wall biosynthesis
VAEVVGDAAVLVDPLNASAIADGMVRVLRDDSLRTDLIRRGRERVKMFSWERSVARIRQVYGELVQTPVHV